MKLNTAITRDEMETHIIMDGSGKAMIDTTVPKTIRKCQKLGYKTIREDTYDGRVVGACFEVPEKCVSLRKESKPMNEEKRRVLAERMRQYHSKGGES